MIFHMRVRDDINFAFEVLRVCFLIISPPVSDTPLSKLRPQSLLALLLADQGHGDVPLAHPVSRVPAPGRHVTVLEVGLELILILGQTDGVKVEMRDSAALCPPLQLACSTSVEGLTQNVKKNLKPPSCLANHPQRSGGPQYRQRSFRVGFSLV